MNKLTKLSIFSAILALNIAVFDAQAGGAGMSAGISSAKTPTTTTIPPLPGGGTGTGGTGGTGTGGTPPCATCSTGTGGPGDGKGASLEDKCKMETAHCRCYIDNIPGGGVLFTGPNVMTVSLPFAGNKMFPHTVTAANCNHVEPWGHGRLLP